jgi:hypothetical protein
MSERIKELCEQVGIKWRVNWRHQDAISGTMTLKQFEKFTQLIVQECITMADDFECDVNQRGLVDQMKRHFEVEE